MQVSFHLLAEPESGQLRLRMDVQTRVLPTGVRVVGPMPQAELVQYEPGGMVRVLRCCLKQIATAMLADGMDGTSGCSNERGES